MARRLTFPIGLSVGYCLLCLASDALAAVTKGQVRVGAFSSNVDFAQPKNGETTNDAGLFFGRFNLNLEELNAKRDFITVDVRDQYDVSGTLEPELLTFGPANKLIVREAAYKRPYTNNRFFFSAGRFGVPDAGILVNDGGEAGYRLNDRLRLGIFAGQMSEDLAKATQFEAVQPDVKYNPLQFGAYTVYESKSLNRIPSLRVANAVSQTPSLDILGKASRLFFHNQGIFHVSESNRFGTLVNFDLSPKAALREAMLSHYFYTNRVRVYTVLAQINVADYLTLRAPRDPLPTDKLYLQPSAYQSLSARGVFRATANLSLELDTQYAKRDDGYSKTDIALGPTYDGFLRRRLSFTFLIGSRKNFISNDSYYKFITNYYRSAFSVSASYYQAKESYIPAVGGTVLNPKIANIDIGYFLNSKLRGSVGANYLQDERVTAKSFLVMIGYRFGDAATSPVRDQVPVMEEL